MSPKQSNAFTLNLPGRRALRWLLLLTLLMVLVACREEDDGAGGGQPTQDISQESSGNPTPFPQVVTPMPSTPEPVVVGVSDAGTFPVAADAPMTITVRGQDFAVQPQSIGADGLWNPDVGEGAAAWVNGSVVNFVFGLADLTGNETLLNALAPGDEIVITTQQGNRHLFSFDSRNVVASSDRNVFNQQTPGVTLLLLGGEGEERLTVRGRYEVGAAANTSQGNVIQMSETAQLGDLQITPTASSYLANRPEAPAGFGFFLIDFSMTNTGLTAIDTNTYRFVLSDELGNQYALNPIASRLGNYPPVGGFLNAGQTMNATAGYQLPVGLVSPTLTWTVSDPNNASIEVIVPFTAGADAAQTTIVSIISASVTSDLNNLIINGQITNAGAQPLVVNREDLTLRTAAGSDYLLLATNPPFPWTVPPNQTLAFFVTYQRPIGADSAVFTVLGQPFELSGLQPQPPTAAPQPVAPETPTATP